RQYLLLAGEREQLDDGEPNLAVLVPLDGADERLDFAGLRHQEEEREGLVGLLAALAGELRDGLAGQPRRGDGRADVAAAFGRGLAQGARERLGAVGAQLVEGARGGAADFPRLVVEGRADVMERLVGVR